MKWASPTAAGLRAFFTPSKIGSDFDELKVTNDKIQQKIGPLLNSTLNGELRSDWKMEVDKAAKSAFPQLKQR